MSKKKNIKYTSAKTHNLSAPLSAAATGAGSSFWQKLLTDSSRLFLYQKICIFLVAFLVFANSIPNDFNIDDTYYTTKDNPISNMGLKAIPQIFTTRTLYDNSKNNFDYRPIPMLSFAVQHQFLGSNPVLSHFINVLLYSFICLLIFLLLYYWFGPSKAWFAFFVALIYTVHPLHTEVVDSIKSRDDLMATLFTLLSMRLIWKWHTQGNAWRIVLSTLLFLTALLCKTTVLAYIVIVPLAFYFFTDMPLRKIAIPFTILVLAYMLEGNITHHFLPETKRTFLEFENPMMVRPVSLAIKTATVSYILGWYAYLHVLPYPLSFYYGYKYVDLLDWSHLLPALSLVLHIILLFLIVKNFRKRSIVAFGGLCYLACIFPFSNLAEPVPGMMAERFTFPATLGYSVLLVSALYYLFKAVPDSQPFHKKGLLAVLLLIFTGYAGMTIARNTNWESSWVLYNHDIKHLGKSAKANMLYGELVIKKSNYWRQKFEQAPPDERSAYRDSILQYMQDEKLPFFRTLAIAPDYNKAMNNLAMAYIHDDSFEIARNYLVKAHVFTPAGSEDPNTHYNLAVVYSNLASIKKNMLYRDSSISEFKKAIAIDPTYPAAYKMLSTTYLMLNDTGAAINILTTGIRNIPHSSFAYMELASVYLYKQDTATAILYYEKGAEVPHPDPVLLQMMQKYYRNKNDLKKESYYQGKLNTLQRQ